MASPLRTVIYARQSQTRNDSTSREDQVEHCQRAATRFGLIVVAVIIERASTSGYKNYGRDRVEYNRVVAMIASGEADCVMVYATDRLTRGGGVGVASLTEAFDSRKIGKHQRIFVPSGPVRSTEAEMRGIFDREESDKKSGYALEAAEKHALAGTFNGGGRPYGYNKLSTELIPEEASVIREACTRVLDGESVTSVVIDLNSRGIPTVRGARWQRQSLQNIILAGRISGQRERNVKRGGGELVGMATWPAIITPDETARLRAKVLNRNPAVGQHPRTYSLAGLIYCGECGGRLYSRKQAGNRRYRCVRDMGGCDRTGINAEKTEQWALGQIAFLADRPEVIKAYNQSRAADVDATLQAQVAQEEAELDELRTDYEARLISRPRYLHQAATLRVSIDGKQAIIDRQSASSLVSMNDYIGKGDHLIETWPTLTVDTQRTIFGLFLERVVIGVAVPGRQFDPARIVLSPATLGPQAVEQAQAS